MYEIGSEFSFERINERENLLEVFSRISEKNKKSIEFLRCGRDAIGFVCDDIIAKNDKGVAFIPALSCDSMVKPFEVRGFETIFYKLCEGLVTDDAYLIGEIEKALSDGRCKEENITVLLMNFFGAADISKTAAELKAKFPKLTIIEDVTHIIMEIERYLGSENDSADYVVGSLRKWMGIPDGAIAAGKNEFLMGALTGDTDFVSLRMQALNEKSDYLKNGGEDLKAHFRSLLSDAEDSLNDGLDPYIMSDISADYLSCIDILSICEKRNNNYDNLCAFLKDLPLSGKAFHLLPSKKDENYTAFMLPIILDIDFMRRSAITDEGKNITRDEFEKRLAKNGIYAPVLWPISQEAADICKVSKDFSENMLTFWIDQRYDRFDMEQISKVLMHELSVL